MKIKKVVTILGFIFTISLLTFCDNTNRKTDAEIKTETIDSVSNKNEDFSISNRKRKTISDVVNNTYKSKWLNISGDTLNQIYSAFLHFNLENKDEVDIEFSPECWSSFPLTLTDSTIQVIWNPKIDSKYDFEIVKKIKKNLTKYQNKTFIILTLINDTTLNATYPYSSLINELNKSDKDRIFFTKSFNIDKR
ncbi:MAG: hypothetical protein U0W65_15470 [Bacteroidia bacterium]|nr:hypothetical protein [Bacteroidota bacterium]